MSEHDAGSVAPNACVSCKKGKRKCDRLVPSCSACQRVRRTCHYEEGSLLASNDIHHLQSRELSGESPHGGFLPATRSSVQARSHGMFFTAPFHSIDPFLHESLAKPAVAIALSAEAAEVLGMVDDVHHMVTRYFETNWKRFPIVSKAYVYDRIQSMFTKPQADFIVLCLCMHLIIKTPSEYIQSMQSSLYVFVKSSINLLESTSFLSLEVIQARLIISYYELGHRMNPAASISIGACARAARALGLNKKCFQKPVEGLAERRRAEEQKRVWWGVIILDRYINLCNGDALFATEDPQLDDHLPIDDATWAADCVLDSNKLTLATPPDIRVGTFARECQVSHLLGRVLRHVFDPVSDPEFYDEEVLQLERTLTAFLPVLKKEQESYGLYCAAFGITCSALFTLYDAALLRSQEDEGKKARICNALKETSMRLVQFSAYLFGNISKDDIPRLSPLVPYCLYQASVVQFRLWKETNAADHREALDSSIHILGIFNRRWLIGGRYLDALEALNVDWPLTMLPLQGLSVSVRGPTDEASMPYMS